MKRKLNSPKAIAGLAVAGGLLILVAGWLLLISPQRSKASKLGAQVQSVQTEIATRRAALAAKPKIKVSARASDLYRLTKAIPDRADMATVMLELNKLAAGSGVVLDSVTPSQVVLGTGYNVQPIAVAVQGRYAQIGSFLNRLRHTVTVRRGKLDARGRLYTVDSVEFAQDDEIKFPSIKATVTIDAFVYAGGSAPSGTTTQTSSTPPSGAVAAGATP